MANQPTHETDLTCPVSSNNFYDNDGNLIDNSHIHDNRYYTKSEVNSMLENTAGEIHEHPALTNGLGIQELEYNGTETKQVSLDFENSTGNPKIGYSSRPARSDHYHDRLIEGEGIKAFTYNGSGNKTVSIDFDSNGISSKVSRSDHIHGTISTGVGLKNISYNGSQSVIIEVNFSQEPGSKYGIENTVSRSDHYHENLVSGNGIAFFEYDGSQNKAISVEYEGFGNDFGSSVKVARGDHNHHSLYPNISYLNENFIREVSISGDDLIFKNGNNIVLNSIIPNFSNETGKLKNPINISLSGDVNGSISFDGSESINISTQLINVSSLPNGFENLVQDISGNLLQSITSSGISFTYNDSTNTLNSEVLYANKLKNLTTISFNGDITGQFEYDGSSSVNSSILLSDSIETKNKIKTIIKDIFTGNYEGLSLNYDESLHILNIDTTVYNNQNYFNKNTSNIPNFPNLDLGSSTIPFGNLYSQNINSENIISQNIEITNSLLSPTISAGNIYGYLNGTAESADYLDGYEAADFSLVNHQHDNSTILPNKILLSNTESIIHALDDNLILSSDTNIIFQIDNDDNETDKEFIWKTNTSSIVMTLNEQGNLNISNNLTVQGNLNILGTTTTINSQNLSVSDNIILLNKDEIGDGVSSGFSGIEIERGTQTNYKFQFNESTDYFEVGMDGNLQTVATRETNPISWGIPFWNNTSKLFITNGNLKYNSSLNELQGINLSLVNVINSTTWKNSITEDNYEISKNGTNILRFNGTELSIDGVNLSKTTHNHDSRYFTETEINSFFEGINLGKQTIDWGNIVNKPTTFTPATHNHNSLYVKLSGGSTVLGKTIFNEIDATGSISGLNGNNVLLYGTESILSNNITSSNTFAINGGGSRINLAGRDGLDGKITLTTYNINTGGTAIGLPTNELKIDSTGILFNSNKIWHGGNHGPSSGLNADLIDGLHASSFGRRDTLTTYNAAQVNSISTLTSASSITINMNLSNNFSLTLNQNTLLANPSNMNIGQSGYIIIKQDSTGNRNLSFGTYWKKLTTFDILKTINSVTVLEYVIISSTEIHLWTNSVISEHNHNIINFTSYTEKLISHGNTSGNKSINISTGLIHSLTCTGATTISFTGWQSGSVSQSVVLSITNGSTNITWPTSVKWEDGTLPELSTGIDRLVFVSDDNGTTILGHLAGKNYS